MYGSPIPGPRVDPVGWTISRFTVEGRLFNQRDVSVECQFAYSNPRQYTRGTSIPIFLSVVIDTDEQAAQFLSAPQNWTFVLLRCTRLINTPDQLARPGSTNPTSTFVEVVSQGRTWKNTGLHDSEAWPIRGEIDIPNASYPTFRLPNLTVDYAVRMIPATTGFKPRPQPHQVDVVVVTSHAQLSMNPEFISETPAPAYQDSVRMRPRNSPK
ncbi:hypothetical protein BS47DRAFT_554107 [Hydnum rufescens UP504]|uniref:Uncharacterized protein n=1 Tax=Hydnum rufescens UP504 TaxID=1448309 RepID=A0A9P6B433_9AGAM|nr:hypothetical protein BS47DRAFT_554107 [Hydnum rufescens UP504]